MKAVLVSALNYSAIADQFKNNTIKIEVFSIYCVFTSRSMTKASNNGEPSVSVPATLPSRKYSTPMTSKIDVKM
jgi:hypothetical protein